MVDRFIRNADLVERLGVTRATIYRWGKNGMLPPRVHLSPGVSGWWESALTEWGKTAGPLPSATAHKDGPPTTGSGVEPRKLAAIEDKASDNTKVKLQDWTLFDPEEEEAIGRVIRKSAIELVNILISRDVNVFFPMLWSSQPQSNDSIANIDPLDIYIVFGEEEVVLKSISLTDTLALAMEACECDGSFRPGLKKMSASMKELAARIDSVL